MKTVFKLEEVIDLAKAPYKTKQMTELLTFLKSVQGSHVTVSDICAYFQAEGDSSWDNDNLSPFREDG